MKTLPSGEPLSGWHWVCPCGFSLHQNKDEIDHMLRKARDHRRWHREQIRDTVNNPPCPYDFSHTRHWCGNNTCRDS